MLKLSMFNIWFLTFISSLMSFFFSEKTLKALLSLEYMLLSGFWLLSLMSFILGMEIYMALFMLTLGVCEGALGLSLLVCLARTLGSDKLNSSFLLMW